ncbi:hypothetical protein SAMN04487777_107131 [Priestia aryabhattai B8W22]|nr:hypothetical protein SAMN04487777_107131 [Priestia aryabhattai B8W22]
MKYLVQLKYISNENYAEISFGDADTGLDVCYTITKY